MPQRHDSDVSNSSNEHDPLKHLEEKYQELEDNHRYHSNGHGSSPSGSEGLPGGIGSARKSPFIGYVHLVTETENVYPLQAISCLDKSTRIKRQIYKDGAAMIICEKLQDVELLRRQLCPNYRLEMSTNWKALMLGFLSDLLKSPHSTGMCFYSMPNLMPYHIKVLPRKFHAIVLNPKLIPKPLKVVMLPDSRSSQCYFCERMFYFIRWKHHCRACGQIYCDHCSKWKAVGRWLETLCSQECHKWERVCECCFYQLEHHSNANRSFSEDYPSRKSTMTVITENLTQASSQDIEITTPTSSLSITLTNNSRVTSGSQDFFVPIVPDEDSFVSVVHTPPPDIVLPTEAEPHGDIFARWRSRQLGSYYPGRTPPAGQTPPRTGEPDYLEQYQNTPPPRSAMLTLKRPRLLRTNSDTRFNKTEEYLMPFV